MQKYVRNGVFERKTRVEPYYLAQVAGVYTGHPWNSQGIVKGGMDDDGHEYLVPFEAGHGEFLLVAYEQHVTHVLDFVHGLGNWDRNAVEQG
jgi:hypothetical protein